MFKLIPFEHAHLRPLLEQTMNAHIKPWMQNLEALEKGWARTGMWRGEVVICGGVNAYWENRGQVWTVFSENTKGNFLPVFRIMKDFLRQQPYKRLEMCVPSDFELGHRRARLLGFEVECPLARSFLPDGEDAVLYSIVKG